MNSEAQDTTPSNPTRPEAKHPAAPEAQQGTEGTEQQAKSTPNQPEHRGSRNSSLCAGWVCCAVLFVLLLGALFVVWRDVDARLARLDAQQALLAETQRGNQALATTAKKLRALLSLPPCNLPDQVEGHLLTTSTGNVGKP